MHKLEAVPFLEFLSVTLSLLTSSQMKKEESQPQISSLLSSHS